MLCHPFRQTAAIVALSLTFCMSQSCPGAEQPPADAPSAPDRTDQRPAQPDRVAPEPVVPDRLAPEPFPPASMLASRGPILRLASVPNMLGDFFNQGGQVRMTGVVNALADMPLAGGGRRAKIAENNKALPMDRCYFMYHHFHNALEADPNTLLPGLARNFSVNRYTIGLEKRFLNDRWSIDVRMPFTEDYGWSPGKFAVAGGDIGNLSVTLKRLLAVSHTGAVAAGLMIDTPTGSDATCRAVTTNVTLHNDAVHLSPYVGFLRAPNNRLFYQGFLQVDVAANGNRVDYVDTGLLVSGTFGNLNEQTLLHADLSAGYWLYRNCCRRRMTGLAGIVEFHYTTALQNADVVPGSLAGTNFQFGNLRNRFDLVNLTAGLHAELARRTTVRVAGAFPIATGPEKPFDAEVQVSVNRRF